MKNELVTARGTEADGFGAAATTDKPISWQVLVEAYERCLLAGDFLVAQETAIEALRGTGDLASVYLRMIAPALRRVGDLWQEGTIGVADEHLATAAALRAMEAAFVFTEQRVSPAPRCVLVTAAEGEQHTIGMRMTADLLTVAGHEVIDCGALPEADLVRLVDATRTDALVVAATMPRTAGWAAGLAASLWSTQPDLPILLGGAGVPSVVPAGPLQRLERIDGIVAAVDALPSRAVGRASIVVPPNPLADLPRVEPAPLDARPEPASVGVDESDVEAIFDGSGEALATIAGDGTITAWNEVAADLYGYSAVEAIGRPLGSVLGPPRQAKQTRRRLREVMAGNRVEIKEPIGVDGDGVSHSIFMRLIPVRDASGAVVRAVLVASQIAEGLRRPPVEVRPRLWHRRVERALDEDLFVLAAQPVVDLRTERVDHCELLLRMRVGDELVMPDEFMPAAERSGQIRAIDLWVARRAIETARRFPVAVNLSSASLANRDLLAEIRETLTRTEVDPSRVSFEISEMVAADNLDDAVALVSGLRELGCRVALDDFGSGSGTSSCLNRLAVSELKIDGEFAGQIRDGLTERRIVDAIVAVGRAFGIRTVAEGIEDLETLNRLRDCGVDLGQGYFLGRPEPVEDETALSVA